MKEEFEDIFYNDEYNELIHRYEEMVKKKTQYFFDVSEFESIIDYYMESNKANSAYHVVQFADQQHPGSLNIQLKKAQVLIDKGQAPKALKIIEQIERIESSNSDVYLLKGSTLNVMGRYSDAVRAFDTAVIYSYEDKLDIIHTIAQSFEQIGKYKTALRYLHQAYQLDNKNIMLLYDIGYCYEKIGQVNKSIEFYHQYLDEEPFSENAWYNLGVLHNKFDQYDKAIEAFEFAIAINPDFSVAYFNLANAFSNKEDYLNAILNYKEYLNFEGRTVEILTYIGDNYESLKEYDLALKYYDEAIQEDNTYADAHFGKANLMYRQGKFKLAIKFVQLAIEKDDINAEYHYLMGSIYNELNENKKALSAYKRAYDLDPEEQDFVFSLAESYVNIKKVDKALKLLSDFLKDNTRNALVYYRLAGLYFLHNQESIALEMFRHGLKLNPKTFLEIVIFYPEAMENKKINNLINRSKQE